MAKPVLTSVSDRLPAWAWAIVRVRYPGLVLLCLALGLKHSPVGDWGAFQRSAPLLLPLPDGFGVYTHERGSVQVGPLALVAAAPFTWLGQDAAVRVVAVVLMLMLPATVAVCEVTARHRFPDLAGRVALTVTVLGPPVVLQWRSLATVYLHLDDALVVFMAACCAYAVVRERPVLLGACVGVAADCKPWALPLVCLVAALPARRAMIRALVTAGVVVVVAWAPFVTYPGALSALTGFRSGVMQASPLALLGLAGDPMPGWVRPAQLILGTGVALLAVRRGRWELAPFAVIAARVALDPNVWPYYFAGLAAAALVHDVLTPRRLPWLTAFVVILQWDIKRIITAEAAQPWLNLTPLAVSMLISFTTTASTAQRHHRSRA